MKFNIPAPLEFTKREPNEKYQVRFWSTPQLYKSFAQRASKDGLVIQDVFRDFMHWFIKRPEMCVKGDK